MPGGIPKVNRNSDIISEKAVLDAASGWMGWWGWVMKNSSLFELTNKTGRIVQKHRQDSKLATRGKCDFVHL